MWKFLKREGERKGKTIIWSLPCMTERVIGRVVARREGGLRGSSKGAAGAILAETVVAGGGSEGRRWCYNNQFKQITTINVSDFYNLVKLRENPCNPKLLEHENS